MSALSRGGLFASFEDDKEEVAAAEVVEEAQNAEADLGAAQDELNEAEEAARVVDQASDDADTLEEVADTLESREESGGATPEEIEMAEVTVESICNRLGIKKPVSLAAESFSSRSDRKRQTQLAVEGIREIGDTIWQTILKIYKKIREWIMKAWDYFFDARTKLLRRAKALEARVDKVEGTPKEAVIQGSFIEGLINQGKFGSSTGSTPTGSTEEEARNAGSQLDTLVKGLAQMEKGLKEVVDEANKNIKDNKDNKIAVSMSKGKDDDGTEVTVVEAMKSSAALAVHSLDVVTGLIDSTVEAMSKNGKKALVPAGLTIGSKVPAFITDADKLKTTIDGVYSRLTKINGASDYEAANKTIVEAADIINKIKVQYVDVGGKINKDYKAPVLNEDQMSKAVSSSIQILESIETFNKNKKKLTDSFKRMESIAASAAHVSTGKLSPELKKSITAATKINAKVTQVVTSFFSLSYRYNIDVVRHILDYVQKSLAQYKQNEDDED